MITVHFRKQIKRGVFLLFHGYLCRIKLRKCMSKKYSDTSFFFTQGRTFRLTPRIFFSPSNRLSNLPILAVLILVVARVFSISIFRCWWGLPVARATFCWCFFSFLDILSFRASRATFRGSWSTSEYIYIYIQFNWGHDGGNENH